MGSSPADDDRWMHRALFHAARGRGRTSPNPMVGAVVVSTDGVVLGQGYHHHAGEAHAEINALDEAGERAQGATLYSTLEPCSHRGRTGPCVQRIVEAGIARVVASTEDPNPLVSGRGFAFLRAHGVDVQVGPGAEAATRLNQPYFTRVREGRPFVIMKAALSADGCLAEGPGLRTYLTSDAASRHTHLERAEIDAIAVGVGTVIVDDPELTPRGAFRERPLTRVVFDRTLRTPPDSRLLSTREAGPVIIVTTDLSASRAELGAARSALEDRGAVILPAGDGGLKRAFAVLAARDVGLLLLEGGAIIHAAAWDAGLVDFVRLYITPQAMGPQGVRWLPDRAFSDRDLIDRRTETLGPDVLIEGYVHRPH